MNPYQTHQDSRRIRYHKHQTEMWSEPGVVILMTSQKKLLKVEREMTIHFICRRDWSNDFCKNIACQGGVTPNVQFMKSVASTISDVTVIIILVVTIIQRISPLESRLYALYNLLLPQQTKVIQKRSQLPGKHTVQAAILQALKHY